HPSVRTRAERLRPERGGVRRRRAQRLRGGARGRRPGRRKRSRGRRRRLSAGRRDDDGEGPERARPRLAGARGSGRRSLDDLARRQLFVIDARSALPDLEDGWAWVYFGSDARDYFSVRARIGGRAREIPAGPLIND